MKQKFSWIASAVSFTLIIGSCGFSIAQSPPWLWAHDLGQIYGIKEAITDSGGVNIYADYDVDISIGGIILKADSSGFSGNCFVAHYDKNGILHWAKKIGSALIGISHGNNRVTVTNIITDLSENIYAIGYYQDTAKFNDTVMYSQDYVSIFVEKFDASGKNIWVKTILQFAQPVPSNSPDVPYALVATDLNGHLYIGCDSGNINNRQPMALEFDTNGTVLWQKVINVEGDCTGISSDSLQNVYLICTKLTSQGSTALLAAKLKKGGDIVWTFSDGGVANYCPGTGIISDHQSNVYISGIFGDLQFGDTILHSTGGSFSDIYLLKLDLNGKFLWVNQAGGYRPDNASAVAIDSYDNAYVTGTFQDSATFGNYVLKINNIAGNIFGFRTGIGFLAKYDPQGSVKWAISPQDNSGYWEGQSIKIDLGTNTLYLAGGYQGKVQFNKTIFGDSLNSSGSFISAMNLNNTSFVFKSSDASLSIQISPNPTTGVVTIRNVPSNITHLIVTNIIGESIIELANPNAPEFMLDLSKLPSGTYLVRFVMEGEVITQKIMKE